MGILSLPFTISVTYLLDLPSFYWIFRLPIDKSSHLGIGERNGHGPRRSGSCSSEYQKVNAHSPNDRYFQGNLGSMPNMIINIPKSWRIGQPNFNT